MGTASSVESDGQLEFEDRAEINRRKYEEKWRREGYLDMDGFIQYARYAYPRATPDASFLPLFRGMDLDKDGYLSYDEFRTYTAIMQGTDYDRIVERAFTMYDADADGVVTKEELARCMADFHRWKGIDPAAPNVHDRIDARASQLLVAAGVGEDGRLTLGDVQRAVAEEPRLLKIL
eukprot:gb/GECH01005549.1/.p1 GENE.gb/GECH01005549.1/~~gb/GECH01005549.1/.p1  ORF type:complete len:177 (+),score=34.01 gb/GECH01005549.1/:1-531(+)